MKLSWKQIEPFVKNPDPAARAILVYGPDHGLAKDRIKTLSLTVVSDLKDPFNVSTIDGEALAEDPSKLSAEAKAMSMMGGARVIRVEGAADKITPVLKDYLDDPSARNLVIIEAGDLKPKSPLRQLFEKAKNAAALPCYVEDERAVSTLIRESLKAHNLFIEPDAMSWMAASIGGDRLQIRGEIDKLITYMGGESAKASLKANLKISLEDVQACCGQAGAQGLDDLIYAFGSPNTGNVFYTYNKLIGEGIPVIVICRTLHNHFRRIHLVQNLMQSGQGLDQAMKTLYPPVFFKYEKAFIKQVHSLKSKDVLAVLSRLQKLEERCKKTGFVPETLCAQELVALGHFFR